MGQVAMSELELTNGVSISAKAPGGGELRLRWATPADAPTLERWDREPDVIAATTDLKSETAFGDHNWRDDLTQQTPANRYFIAELAVSGDAAVGRPIGAMQIIDPHQEPTHYWGDVARNQRAVDIWIGDPKDRNHGFGAVLMKMAEMLCFSHPAVTAILIDPLNSNARAHRFYQRLGYKPVGRQVFNNGEDDCLVHILTRTDWNARTPPKK
jgi:aminoglycoside 6'-N-acetyltransferase